MESIWKKYILFVVSIFMFVFFAFSLPSCGKQNNNPQLDIIPTQATVKPGGQQVFSAFRRGDSASDVTAVWSSNNPDVAVVSEHGVATALQEGQSHIVVSIEEATAEATLVVTDSSPRPIEILNVVPFENETVSLSGPECLYVFPPCKLPQLSSVGADFAFPGDDSFESAQLFIDGKEVTVDSMVIVSKVSGLEKSVSLCTPEGDCSTMATEMPGIEGSIYYPHLRDLSLGAHQATVAATSKGGKNVLYDWRFSIVE